MNLLDKILEKLGLKRTAAPATDSDKFAGKFAGKGGAAAVSTVDVVGKLDRMAATNPQKLNWKRSIVDLLKLLNLDSSLDERKQLATALGCPPDKMGGDYAAMNIWLHKTVMQRLAANGGNIPKELLA